MKSVCVLCAGEQKRFPKSFPPKHLLAINGQPLIQRIVTQCKQRGYEPWIVSHHQAVRSHSMLNMDPQERTTILHTLRSTKDLWEGFTIILLGDVFYPEDVMTRIWNFDKPLSFWLSGSEIYALTFTSTDYYKVVAGIENCIVEVKVRARRKTIISVADRKLWHLYSWLSGGDIHQHRIYDNDLTEKVEGCFDIDSERQYLDHSGFKKRRR